MKRATVYSKNLKTKQLSQKKRRITLNLILKRLLTLVSYIFYPRRIKSSVMCRGRRVNLNFGTTTEKVSEFLHHHFQQISGTAIGTKFAPNTLVFLWSTIETEILKTQSIKAWL